MELFFSIPKLLNISSLGVNCIALRKLPLMLEIKCQLIRVQTVLPCFAREGVNKIAKPAHIVGGNKTE